jgi:hypothetical protein
MSFPAYKALLNLKRRISFVSRKLAVLGLTPIKILHAEQAFTCLRALPEKALNERNWGLNDCNTLNIMSMNKL